MKMWRSVLLNIFFPLLNVQFFRKTMKLFQKSLSTSACTFFFDFILAGFRAHSSAVYSLPTYKASFETSLYLSGSQLLAVFLRAPSWCMLRCGRYIIVIGRLFTNVNKLFHFDFFMCYRFSGFVTCSCMLEMRFVYLSDSKACLYKVHISPSENVFERLCMDGVLPFPLGGYVTYLVVFPSQVSYGTSGVMRS